MIAHRAGSPAWQVVVARAPRRARDRLRAWASLRSPGCCCTPPCARRRCTSDGSAVTPLDVAALGAIASWSSAGRAARSTRRDSRAGGRVRSSSSCRRLIVFAAAVAAARLLTPALRGTRSRRAARVDLASPRRRFARAQPGPRGRGRHVPRCEPRARTLRGRLPLDAVRGQHDEASYAVPASYVLSEDLSQLVPVLHGVQLGRLPGNARDGAAALRQRPVRDDLRLPGPAGLGAPGRRRLARRLRAAVARTARRVPHASQRGPADADASGGPAVHASRLGARGRRRDPRDLPLTARRLRGGPARPHRRSTSRRAPRAHSVPFGDARATGARHPEQRHGSPRTAARESSPARRACSPSACRA